MQWPADGRFLIPGVNDTWNEFQKKSRGQSVTSIDWKNARETLYQQFTNFIADGGSPIRPEAGSRRQGIVHSTIFSAFTFSTYRKGASLTHKQVLEIFNCREIGQESRLGAATARTYGVTAKAVRDIWKQRTWMDVTSTCVLSDKSKLSEGRIAIDNSIVHSPNSVNSPGLKLPFPAVPAVPSRRFSTFEYKTIEPILIASQLRTTHDKFMQSPASSSKFDQTSCGRSGSCKDSSICDSSVLFHTCAQVVWLMCKAACPGTKPVTRRSECRRASPPRLRLSACSPPILRTPTPAAPCGIQVGLQLGRCRPRHGRRVRPAPGPRPRGAG